MTKYTLLSALSALALAACGQSTQTTEAPTLPEAPLAGSAQTAVSNAEFVQAVASADAFEVQSSELAATRAARQQVKDFATMMVRDHTATSAELTALAPTLGLSAPSPTIDANHQTKLDSLRAANGAAFDDAYLDAQVEAHENAIRAFENFAANGEAGALRDWANTTLPKLRTHLTQVQALENAT
jgi:putative membrane protein